MPEIEKARKEKFSDLSEIYFEKKFLDMKKEARVQESSVWEI